MARRLFIYGTVYNNVDRVKACVDSLTPLNAHHIYVTDNYSNDGSYEILSEYPGITVIREKCKRGAGRGIALQKVLAVAKPEDCVLYLDFDAIYKKKYIAFIKNKIKSLRDNELYADIGSLSTIKTNHGLTWAPLQGGEDTERLANAVTKGIKIYFLDIKSESEWHKYWDNGPLAGGDTRADREARYTHNTLSKYIRWFTYVVDEERGRAVRSFSEFYAKGIRKKTLFTLVGYRTAFFVAKLKGLYVHDKYLDNTQIIDRNKLYIKG